MKLVFNGADTPAEVKLPKGKWTVVSRDGQLCHTGLTDAEGNLQILPGGKTTVEPRSALILYR